MNKFIIATAIAVAGIGAYTVIPPRAAKSSTHQEVPPPPSKQVLTGDTASRYTVVNYPTPNVDTDRVNEVRGVILHHTAEPTVQRSLYVLTRGPRHVGTHVVIDTDGTRYVMCRPDQVTFHAGKSYLAGREGCNNFTVGIEFQGNTLEKPLTQDQIDSAVEYLRPIIAQYNIPLDNIVTHEMVRIAYKKRHPHERCYGKVDITPAEYQRFMKALKEQL